MRNLDIQGPWQRIPHNGRTGLVWSTRRPPSMIDNCVSCSMSNMTCHVAHNWLPHWPRTTWQKFKVYSKLDKVAMQLHWKMMISHESARMSIQDYCLGLAIIHNSETIPNLPGSTGDEPAYSFGRNPAYSFVPLRLPSRHNQVAFPALAPSAWGSAEISFTLGSQHEENPKWKLRTKNGARCKLKAECLMLHI